MTAVTRPFAALVELAGRRSAPSLVDLEGDGDLDLLVGTESAGLMLYRNAGTPERPRFERDSTFHPPVPALAVPAAGDIDGDGIAELIVGNVGGGAVYLTRQDSSSRRAPAPRE